MRIDQVRFLFGYHRALNRKVWDESVMALSQEQFIADNDYSVGSVRNQVVHMFAVDAAWLAGLSGSEGEAWPNPVHWPDRDKIRARWDEVDAAFEAWLEGLSDADLERDVNEFPLWQALQHILFHGVDHRAQLLAALHALGAPTFPQDMAIWAEWRRG